MTVLKKIYTPVDIEITKASLLTVDEIEKVPMRLREYSRWYWSASPGKYDYYASCFNKDGSVYEIGSSVMYTAGALRPALFTKSFSLFGFNIGDIFVFGDKEFEVVTDDMAFILTDIGINDFRYDGDFKNDYEISGAKRAVDSWFNDAMSKD